MSIIPASQDCATISILELEAERREIKARSSRSMRALKARERTSKSKHRPTVLGRRINPGRETGIS